MSGSWRELLWVVSSSSREHLWEYQLVGGNFNGECHVVVENVYGEYQVIGGYFNEGYQVEEGTSMGNIK